jgi:hypothetical protein
MGITLTTKIICDGCQKNIEAKAVKVRGRHSETLTFPDVYRVGVGNWTDETLDIQHGSTEYELEGNKIACSPECAIRVATSLIAELK